MRFPHGKPIKLLADFQNIREGRLVQFEIFKRAQSGGDQRIDSPPGRTLDERMGIGFWTPTFFANGLPVLKLPVLPLKNRHDEGGMGPLGNEYEKKMYYTGGDKETLVKTLQQMLNLLGRTLDVNGIFDKRTEDEVKNFQRTHIDCEKKPLRVDGLVGPRTSDALNKRIEGLEHNLWYIHEILPLEEKATEQVQEDKYYFKAKLKDLDQTQEKESEEFTIGYPLTIRLTSKDGHPIEGIHFTVKFSDSEGTTKNGITNEAGEAYFDNVPKGNFEINLTGYEFIF